MLRTIQVDIPYKQKLLYSLYARGALVGSPTIDETEDFAHLIFLQSGVLCLFYEFKSNPRPIRRAYVVTLWEPNLKLKKTTLPGLDFDFAVIFTARGKEIDFLKRSLFIISDNQENPYRCFTFPLTFWYKLAGLIEYSGAKRSDINSLYKSFLKFGS